MKLNVSNYINGRFTQSTGKNFIVVQNPTNGEELTKTPLSTQEELNEAINFAQVAFKLWSKTPVQERVQPLFKLKQKLEANLTEIAKVLTLENGKTLKEAQGDLLRGLQMVEVACGMTSFQMGEFLNDVAQGIDSQMIRRPLGVFAGICPFNFPAMIPFWFWPFAVASGNTFILKPSERVPLTQMKIFELISECGFPPGVINMVHGAKEIVNGLLEHPLIKGVSFVGSTPVAQHIYQHGAKHLKRVQSLGGAKNYMVILEDADFELSIKAMVDSCYGCAGERCLAGSILVGVGDAAYEKLKKHVLAEVKKVKIGNPLLPETTLGPVISKEAKNRIIEDINKAIEQGAHLLVDGRAVHQDNLPGELSSGHFLGPTVLSEISTSMEIAHKEIFGPVIGLLKVNNLDEAIEAINKINYANTASLFTNHAPSIRKFNMSVDPAMIGINLGVPAPMAFFSFGGSKNSFFGDVKAHGRDAIHFYTEKQTIMSRFFGQDLSANNAINPQWGKSN